VQGRGLVCREGGIIMAFGSFKTLQEVAKAYQIAVKVEPFLKPLPVPVDNRLREELTFSLENLAVRVSEAAIAEFLIAPILREVWKPYRDALSLWSHAPLGTEDPLSGTPDYVLFKRSPLGHLVQDQPYLLVVEAKKDDFDAGWGQCLAAMLAAQRMNEHPDRDVFGCVSNGDLWQFG